MPNEDLLLSLEAKKDEILQTFIAIFENRAIFHADMLAQGVMQQALSNICAFVLLTKEENYLCSFAIVRMHLDTILRFSALWLTRDFNELANRILFSDDFYKIKLQDASGRKHKLTSQFLCQKLEAREGVDWIERVFRKTSGFVHTSGVQFFSTLRDTDEENHEFNVGVHGNGKTDCRPEQVIDSIECMLAITDLIIKYLNGWAGLKKNLLPSNAAA